MSGAGIPIFEQTSPTGQYNPNHYSELLQRNTGHEVDPLYDEVHRPIAPAVINEIGEGLAHYRPGSFGRSKSLLEESEARLVAAAVKPDVDNATRELAAREGIGSQERNRREWLDKAHELDLRRNLEASTRAATMNSRYGRRFLGRLARRNGGTLDQYSDPTLRAVNVRVE